MDIKSALLSLDKANAEHWTADGSPRIDAVAALVGSAVKRQEIIDALPGFTRTSENPTDGQPNPEAEAPADDTAAPAPEPDVAPEVDGDVDDDGLPLKEITLDEVRSMTVRELIADREFLAEAIRIAELDAVEKTNQLNAAKLELEKAARLSSRLREVQASTTKAENPNLEYIKSANAERARRASAAKAFLGAGTNVADVMKMISNKAPIDKAFAGRKPGMGTTRPRR